jgi:hypothetical protein
LLNRLSEKHPMTTRYVLFAAAAVVAVLGMQSSAHALTITECSAKYKDGKAAGTLNGATWSDFRKSQCDLAPVKRSARAAGSDVTVVAANACSRLPSIQNIRVRSRAGRVVKPALINTRPTKRAMPMAG